MSSSDLLTRVLAHERRRAAIAAAIEADDFATAVSLMQGTIDPEPAAADEAPVALQVDDDGQPSPSTWAAIAAGAALPAELHDAAGETDQAASAEQADTDTEPTAQQWADMAASAMGTAGGNTDGR